MHVTTFSLLPSELVSMTLSVLDIQSLLQASLVSSTWRSLARSQPEFWRFIRLAALSPAAVAFFAERLGCQEAHGRCVDMVLDLDKAEDPDNLRPAVLTLLTRNLFRINGLHVAASPCMVPALSDSLRHPAPRLEKFELHYNHSKNEALAPPLPVDLFAGSSPRLGLVLLRDVQLPRGAIAAFRKVTKMTFVSDVPQSIAYSFISHFPSATMLSLIGTSCQCNDVAMGDIPNSSASDALRIDWLHLSLQLPHFERFLAAMPNLGALRRIQCREGPPRLVGMLLNHMLQLSERNLRLDLDLDPHPLAETVVSIVYSGNRRRFVRAFHDVMDVARWPVWRGVPVYFAPGLLERVTFLSLHRELVGLVPTLPTLPNCRSLGINCATLSGSGTTTVRNVPAAPRAASGPLLPNLAVVFVHSRTPSHKAEVDAACLADLFSAILHETQVELSLVIQPEMKITGDITQLTRRFRRSDIRA